MIEGVYIDHGSDENFINVCANGAGYRALIKSHIPYSLRVSVEPEISMMAAEELSRWQSQKGECMTDMDFYLSYEAYVQMMYDFESNYPELCKIINIGTLPSGRELLVAQIGDNVQSNQREEEPNFFYTSTMHGDELAGYPLMLQLIDYLLCQYDKSDDIKALLDDVNIYINPLANPDGTYRGGNETVEDAIRFNQSFLDLNRNYPDIDEGDNPDFSFLQKETEYFLDFADSVRINLACNIHSGAEVVNYPWDRYAELHADDAWWRHVCRRYADTVHSNTNNLRYFRDLDNGITNGHAWFEVRGGRQDYMTYYERSREFTLELTNRKILDSSRLPDVWSAHRSSLIGYMEEALYGFHGKVRDCETGEYIEAEIFIPGHDKLNSSVFSDPTDGTFYRYLYEDNYDIEIRAEGYITEVRNIDIIDKSRLYMEIEMCPVMSSSANDYLLDDVYSVAEENKIFVRGLRDNINMDYGLYAIQGQLLDSGKTIDRSIKISNNMTEGFYILKLSHNGHNKVLKVFLK